MRFGLLNLGSESGKGEVCERMRKKMVYMSCLQVRRGELGARMLGM